MQSKFKRNMIGSFKLFMWRKNASFHSCRVFKAYMTILEKGADILGVHGA